MLPIWNAAVPSALENCCWKPFTPCGLKTPLELNRALRAFPETLLARVPKLLLIWLIAWLDRNCERGTRWPVVGSIDRRFRGVVLKKLFSLVVLPAND